MLLGFGRPDTAKHPKPAPKGARREPAQSTQSVDGAAPRAAYKTGWPVRNDLAQNVDFCEEGGILGASSLLLRGAARALRAVKTDGGARASEPDSGPTATNHNKTEGASPRCELQEYSCSAS